MSEQPRLMAHLDIVQAAWTASLQDVPFANNLCWADAGGDSLKTLEMIMRLQDVLGWTIPYEVLTSETTPIHLAESLIVLAAEQGNTASDTMTDGLAAFALGQAARETGP